MSIIKKITNIGLVAAMLFLSMPISVFAENSVSSPEVIVDGEPVEEGVAREPDDNAIADEVVNEPEVCGFTLPEEKTYSSQLIAIRKKLKVETGEEFRIKVFMKNTGSMPWFSNKSTCLGPKMSLGTDKERDRASTFYNDGLDGWESNNRVGMDQLRVGPEEIASFTFWGKASEKSDVFKEYFTPTLKDIQWLDEAGFSFEVMIGNSAESAINLRKKLSYANFSGSVKKIDLNAEKKLIVDLSEQLLKVQLGDFMLREFKVSTGAAKTPTPVGETNIILKQEVRIGAKAPHYVMPKFMMFRAGGYGFHALPSLANDGGVFWTEARNHIGIPVSHGCIRILPEDAEWLFDFTEIGTGVAVQR